MKRITVCCLALMALLLVTAMFAPPASAYLTSDTDTYPRIMSFWDDSGWTLDPPGDSVWNKYRIFLWGSGPDYSGWGGSFDISSMTTHHNNVPNVRLYGYPSFTYQVDGTGWMDDLWWAKDHTGAKVLYQVFGGDTYYICDPTRSGYLSHLLGDYASTPSPGTALYQMLTTQGDQQNTGNLYDLDGIFFDSFAPNGYVWAQYQSTDMDLNRNGVADDIATTNANWESAQHNFLGDLLTQVSRSPAVKIIANDLPADCRDKASRMYEPMLQLQNTMDYDWSSPGDIAKWMDIWSNGTHASPRRDVLMMGHPLSLPGRTWWRPVGLLPQGSWTQGELDKVRYDWRRVRYGLCTALLCDAYYQYSVGTTWYGTQPITITDAGTASIASNSKTLTGSGTSWQTSGVAPGQYVWLNCDIGRSEGLKVSSVNSDTSITVTDYPSQTYSNVSCKIVRCDDMIWWYKEYDADLGTASGTYQDLTTVGTAIMDWTTADANTNEFDLLNNSYRDGSGYIVCSQADQGRYWTEVLDIKTSASNMSANTAYRVTADMEVVAEPGCEFRFQVIPASGGDWHYDTRGYSVRQFKDVLTESGTSMWKVSVDFTTNNYSNYQCQWWMLGGGSFKLKNVYIKPITSGTNVYRRDFANGRVYVNCGNTEVDINPGTTVYKLNDTGGVVAPKHEIIRDDYPLIDNYTDIQVPSGTGPAAVYGTWGTNWIGTDVHCDGNSYRYTTSSSAYGRWTFKCPESDNYYFYVSIPYVPGVTLTQSAEYKLWDDTQNQQVFDNTGWWQSATQSAGPPDNRNGWWLAYGQSVALVAGRQYSLYLYSHDNTNYTLFDSMKAVSATRYWNGTTYNSNNHIKISPRDAVIVKYQQ